MIIEIYVKYSIFNHFSNYCFKLFCWVVILLRYNVFLVLKEWGKKKDFFSIWGKFFNVSLKNIFYKYFVHALAVLRLIILINSEIKTVWPVFTVSEKIKVVTVHKVFIYGRICKNHTCWSFSVSLHVEFSEPWSPALLPFGLDLGEHTFLSVGRPLVNCIPS